MSARDRQSNASRWLCWLLVVISGNPAVSAMAAESVFVVALAVFLFAWSRRLAPLPRRYVLVAFAVMSAIHVVVFGTVVATASVGFLIKLAIGALAAVMIPDLTEDYSAIMATIAAISLVFYIPTQLGIDVQGMLSSLQLHVGESTATIGIYTFRAPLEPRNCGMFWEPGAFAGYLVLALLLLSLQRERGPATRNRVLVIVAALLTTQSSTGYLAFFLVALLHAVRTGALRKRSRKVLLVLLVIGGYLAFTRVPFLGEKLEQQWESTIVDEDQLGRFGNILFDLDDISQRPLLGWSANPDIRTARDSDLAELALGQGVGLTGFATRYGLVGLLLYLGLVVHVARRLSGSAVLALIATAVVCALLIGEQFLNFPVFLVLPFLASDQVPERSP